MATRKTTKPKSLDDSIVGPWRIVSAFPAREGTTACWFVDPSGPKTRRVDCWAFVERDKKLQLPESSTFWVEHERRILPAIVIGGSLELCDDADAIVAPEVDIEAVANGIIA